MHRNTANFKIDQDRPFSRPEDAPRPATQSSGLSHRLMFKSFVATLNIEDFPSSEKYSQAEASHNDEHRTVADEQQNRATAAYNNRRYNEALVLYEQSIAIRSQIKPQTPSDLGKLEISYEHVYHTHMRLGEKEYKNNEFEKAAQSFTRALEAFQHVTGENSRACGLFTSPTIIRIQKDAGNRYLSLALYHRGCQIPEYEKRVELFNRAINALKSLVKTESKDQKQMNVYQKALQAIETERAAAAQPQSGMTRAMGVR